MRWVQAIVGVLGAFAAVGAEDQESLRPAVVFGDDQPFRRVDFVRRREDLVGQAAHGVERHGRRRAARHKDDEHGREHEVAPQAGARWFGLIWHSGSQNGGAARLCRV